MRGKVFKLLCGQNFLGVALSQVGSWEILCYNMCDAILGVPDVLVPIDPLTSQIRLRRGVPPGDGVLFYPGEVFSLSLELLSSVLLERILCGFQDFEYLKHYSSSMEEGQGLPFWRKLVFIEAGTLHPGAHANRCNLQKCRTGVYRLLRIVGIVHKLTIVREPSAFFFRLL